MADQTPAINQTPAKTQPAITLKEDAKKRVIAFNNSAKPLGERDDLDQFAILAYESGRKDYLGLFDKVPTYEALKEAQAEQALKADQARKDYEKRAQEAGPGAPISQIDQTTGAPAQLRVEADK
jgi:hypothetical protein